MKQLAAGRSRLWRWVRRGLMALAALMVATSVAAWAVLGSLPKISGDVIAEAVLGRRSQWPRQFGVVTVTAQSEHDAYFALGFAHAQDRLFQMETSGVSAPAGCPSSSACVR